MAEKDIKFGSVVTGIPESKFDKFIKAMLWYDRSHIIRVAFDEDLGMHVGLGAATVRGCNDKIQIVVVAKRSSNLEKLKVALEKALKSKMKPSKPCSRRLRGANVVGLHYSDINIPIQYSRAMAEKDIKFGSVVTGIPESKFDKFIKAMLWYDRSHIIRVAFDEDLGMHVGLGAATVRGCNDKIQIVVVAKRSSNLEKLKVALEKALKSKMKPSKPCSRRLRGADVL
eukprot:g9941.t1